MSTSNRNARRLSINTYTRIHPYGKESLPLLGSCVQAQTCHPGQPPWTLPVGTQASRRGLFLAGWLETQSFLFLFKELSLNKKSPSRPTRTTVSLRPSSLSTYATAAAVFVVRNPQFPLPNSIWKSLSHGGTLSLRTKTQMCPCPLPWRGSFSRLWCPY